MAVVIFLHLLLLGLSSPAQVTNRFAFPALAGLRLREANITAGTNDGGNGPVYGLPDNYYDQDYYCTNRAGPSGDEWDQWIVPQVLAAKAAGANCVRLTWSADAFVGDSTHHGAAAWVGTNTCTGLTNEIGMVASLCQSNGLWLYPCCTDSRAINDGNLATNQVYLYLSNFCAAAVLYPNVPAIDVVQELDGTVTGTNGYVALDCFLWLQAARDGMNKSRRKVPITCSMNGASAANDLNLVNRWQAYNLAAAGADYFDCHVYYQYSIQDFYQAVTNQWGLPVVFGETGVNMAGVWGSGSDNESSHPYSSEKRQDFFFAAQSVAAQPYYQLTGVWAIAPNWLTNEEDFGLYSGAQDGSYQFTQARDQLRNFAMFPTNVQPVNYSWSVCCTGVNTSAGNYSGPTRYAVQSSMLDATAVAGRSVPMWQRQNNKVQALGNTSTLKYANGLAILWQSALPATLGQSIHFEIPPQIPVGYLGEYVNWECVARGQANGSVYLVSLTHDTLGLLDNRLEIFSFDGATQTKRSLTNLTYLTPLDLAQWWGVTVAVSTNIYPTTITCTVTNLTAGLALTPSLVCTDSTSFLQVPGGMGLCGDLGQPFYTNISFAAVFDPMPTLATPPAATTAGTNVFLSWDAAARGSGTITYLPQYNVSDSFGFPSSLTWTNAIATVSTNETVTNIPANTNLIFRVMTFDSAGATNYSPWQIVTTDSPATNTVNLIMTLSNGVDAGTNVLFLSLQIPPNLNGHIEISTNLIDWQPLTNFTGLETNVTFQNPVPTHLCHCFYRAVVP